MYTWYLILDGNSEIVSRVRSNFCYLICLRHLITSWASQLGFILFPKRSIILHACATCSELQSKYHDPYGPSNKQVWVSGFGSYGRIRYRIKKRSDLDPFHPSSIDFLTLIWQSWKKILKSQLYRFLCRKIHVKAELFKVRSGSWVFFEDIKWYQCK